MILDRELQKFSNLVAALYASPLSLENYIQRSFVFLGALVPNELTGYGALHAASHQLDASFDRHPPGLARSLEAYGRLMHKYEPFRFDPQAHGGRPYSSGDYFSRRQLRDLDIYREVHAPLGFEEQCMINIPSQSDLRVFFGLFRGGVGFSEDDKQILAFAQPHLLNAYRLAIAATAVEDIPFTPDIFTRAGFSSRESEVIFWLTRGRANHDIAKTVRVRTDTVSGYLRGIYQKLGVDNRVSATIAALRIVRRLASHSIRGGDVSYTVPTA